MGLLLNVCSAECRGQRPIDYCLAVARATNICQLEEELQLPVVLESNDFVTLFLYFSFAQFTKRTRICFYVVDPHLRHLFTLQWEWGPHFVASDGLLCDISPPGAKPDMGRVVKPSFPSYFL